MAKKIETKTSGKKGTASRGKNRSKKYPVHHLASVLTCLLILEGILFGVTTSANWQKSANVLDVYAGVSETSQDMTETFRPIFEMVENIDRFYQLAATEMMQVLDLSESGFGSEFGFIYNGVTEFYRQSSMQMAQLLDTSDSSPLLPNAGGF